MIFATRKAHFNAAHRLHNPEKSDEWNHKRFGKCNHPNWHGHNYELEVTVCGEANPDTGYIIDLGTLKTIIQEEIVEKCDHSNLNKDVPFLEGLIPSTENLARAFYEQLKNPVEQASYDNAKLYSVTLHETKNNSATYCPFKTLQNIQEHI